MNTNVWLKEIAELYPQQRVSRSIERYRRVWNLTACDDPPLLAQSWFDVFWPPARAKDKSHYTPERRLQYQLEGIARRGNIDDDFIPCLTPDDRVAVLPSLFGCRIEDKEGEHAWTHPLISEPQEVYSIRKPDVSQDGLGPHVLETIRHFRKETGGSIPIRTCDVQGPLDTASLIMGAETFLEALYTHPQESHYLLNLITDVIIDLYRFQIEAAEGDFVPTHAVPSAWMPANMGVALSDDMMGVISPAQYKEYATPYNERIAAEYGGVFLHSCGNVSRSLATVLETHGLRGVHLGQMSLPTIAPLVGGHTVVIPACQTDLDPWEMVGLDRVTEALEICKEGIYAILVVGAGGSIDQEVDLLSQIRMRQRK